MIRSIARRCFIPVAAAFAFPRAHAGFNFFLSEFTATHAELQTLVQRQFPVKRTYANQLTVTLNDPQLGLNASANRAAITASLAITGPLLQERGIQGRVVVSSELRWDSAGRALRLHEPRTERLELDALEGALADRLQRLGDLVVRELFQDWALKTFTKEEMTVGSRTYEVDDIAVATDGLTVRLR